MPAPYARHRTARLSRGYADALSGCRRDTAPAWHNPRTAPSCRPAPNGAHAAAYISEFHSYLSSGPEEWSPTPAEAAARTPLSWDLRDFPRHAFDGGGVTPSVSATTQIAPLSRSSSPARSFCLRVSGVVAPSAPHSS